MPTLLIWICLVLVTAFHASSRGRKALMDAWPAYFFALPLAVRMWAFIQGLGAPADAPVYHFAVVLQQLAMLTFAGLLVVLFAIRSRSNGRRASRAQAMVALLGTFIVYGIVLLPPQSDMPPAALLTSAALILVGTAFASWSLATLGRCFGIFPEVRGLVVRGPYRLVRHPVYLGEIVAQLGILMLRPHPATLVLLLSFVALQYWRTTFEEAALTAAFSDDYTLYRAKVPRLIPASKWFTRIVLAGRATA